MGIGCIASRRAKGLMLLVALCWGAVALGDDGLSGVYVNKDHDYRRAEFLPGGKCFLTLGGDCAEARYVRERDSFICTIAGAEDVALRLQIRDDVLVDEDGEGWVPREQLVRIPWKAMSPVTMVVLDAETGTPIPEFKYTYTIRSPEAEYDPMLVRPIPVKSPDGSFAIQAPPTCEIGIEIEARDLVGGYGNWRTFGLTSENKERRIEVRVRKGVAVHGTVVDAATGTPIQHARVSPVVFTPPLFTPDRTRSVQTDARGSFTVYGVEPDLGIHASHPDYLDGGWSAEKTADGLHTASAALRQFIAGRVAQGASYVVKIEMEAGEDLLGKINDPTGKPVAGVKVSDGAGKEVQSGADGSFILKSPRKWWNEGDEYFLSLEKDGYVNLTLFPTSADPKGLAVVLEPCPIVVGTVLSPDGKPIPAYRIFAGPEREPQGWQCTSQQVDDPQGEFSLQIQKGRDYEEEGRAWVGVKVPGYAMWDACLDDWKGAKTLTIRLDAGAPVTGKLALPRAGNGRVVVKLVPDYKRPEDSLAASELTQRQVIGSMETSPDAAGAFRFDHVRPGAYVLFVYGPAISPMSVDVTVRPKGLDIKTLSPKGTGIVFGQVYRPNSGGVWAFADGEIHFADSSGRLDSSLFPHLKPIAFKADENGRFRVEGVPAGRVSVDIPFRATADIIDAHRQDVTVQEGQATEVRFFDPAE